MGVAAHFPHTTSAWRRLKQNLRDLVALKLLDWATTVSPGLVGEYASEIIKSHERGDTRFARPVPKVEGE